MLHSTTYCVLICCMHCMPLDSLHYRPKAKAALLQAGGKHLIFQTQQTQTGLSTAMYGPQRVKAGRPSGSSRAGAADERGQGCCAKFQKFLFYHVLPILKKWERIYWWTYQVFPNCFWVVSAFFESKPRRRRGRSLHLPCRLHFTRDQPERPGMNTSAVGHHHCRRRSFLIYYWIIYNKYNWWIHCVFLCFLLSICVLWCPACWVGLAFDPFLVGLNPEKR